MYFPAAVSFLFVFSLLPGLSFSRHTRQSLDLVNGLLETRENMLQGDLVTLVSQFVGILPNEIVSDLFRVLPVLESTGSTNPLLSITATLTGSTAIAADNMIQCVEVVLQQNGLPPGFSCLTSTGLSLVEFETTLNGVIEQGIGILPNALTRKLQSELTEFLTPLFPLVPGSAALNVYIQNSLSSVIASTVGNTVTFLEQMEVCLMSLSNCGCSNTSGLSCILSQGTYTPLVAAFYGLLQQILGYLPPNSVSTLVDTLVPLLGNVPSVVDIGNAIESITATFSGNSVTALELFGNCLTNLVFTNGTRMTKACAGAPQAGVVMINGVLEQLFGVLAPDEVIDLEDVVFKALPVGHVITEPDLKNTVDAINNYYIQRSQLVPIAVEKIDGKILVLKL